MASSDPFRPKRLGLVDSESKLWLFSAPASLAPFLSFPPDSPVSRKPPALLSLQSLSGQVQATFWVQFTDACRQSTATAEKRCALSDGSS